MEKSVSKINDGAAIAAVEYELGLMLGERRAFARVSGRCSAAHAECLRRLRDDKLYRTRCESWEEFCSAILGVSKTHANRIIGWLKEFGPSYFELAELTRITPEEYRALAPTIADKSLQVNGEAIALIPENAGKVASAVAELRRAAAAEARPTVPAGQRIQALEKRCEALAAEFAALSREREQRRILRPVLARTMIRLGEIEEELIR